VSDYRTKREAALNRWGSLKTDRSSWLSHWQELAHWTLPRSGRFLDTNSATAPNRGDKKHSHILNNTPQRAVGIMTAGLMSGASSPARPWFKLRTPYDDLNERPAVKQWLDLVEKRMREVFNGSNTYRALRQNYQELGVFGTAGDIVLDDFDNVIHHYPMTIGEYALDTNDKGAVDSVYRQFDMRASQVVQAFGFDRCSIHVQNMYMNKNMSAWVPVLHVIEPRRERNPLKKDNANMPWSSCYYEIGGQDQDYLRESGFQFFPALTPRWETRGADVYGSSPGMMALGDTKALQHLELRSAQAVDFMSLPPLQAPPNTKLNMAPGGTTFVDTASGGVKSLFDVKLDIQRVNEKIAANEQRVERAYFVDMFLLIIGDSRVQPATAREIAERHEEKLLMLGPVLESLHDEMLSPLVEITFAYMLRNGMIPPAPRELTNVPLVVQFVSLLAQAQRLVGLSSIDRLLGTILNAASLVPQAAAMLDKVDMDQLVDVYADTLGVDPTLIVADEQVAFIRAERQQQLERQQAVEAAPQVAAAAKDMAAAQPAATI
jgi:hypothetical protein